MVRAARLVVVLLYGVATLVHGYVREHPEFVKTCYRSNVTEEDFVNCSTHAVQRLFDEIPNGWDRIDLKPLDPLKVERVQILQGGDGPVTVNASLTNVTAVGFGHTIIVKNEVDPIAHDFHTEVKLNRLRIDGNYELNGKILVIPLVGRGSCWFDAKNLDIIADSDVDLVEVDGFHFFNVTAVHVKFSIGGLKLHMGNLFDGHRVLEASTNAYLNANWRPVADSLNPILSKTIEDIMIGILQKVFINIPAEYFIGDLMQPVKWAKTKKAPEIQVEDAKQDEPPKKEEKKQGRRTRWF